MDFSEGRAIVRANVGSEMSERGWNIGDFARAAGIDLGTAGDFLNGTRWPQRATQRRIELALDWEPGTIFRWERNLPKGYRPGDFSEEQLEDDETVTPADQDAGVLLSMPAEALEGLSPAEREEVIAAARLSALRTAREIRRRIDDETYGR